LTGLEVLGLSGNQISDLSGLAGLSGLGSLWIYNYGADRPLG
jgi:Leucine-rich repeat (LRR) protein